MFIPKEYYLEDGKDQPEGTVIKTCRYCNSRFAVPNDKADNYSDVCDCDECKEKADKDAANASAALMKPKTDAADTVKTALGD